MVPSSEVNNAVDYIRTSALAKTLSATTILESLVFQDHQAVFGALDCVGLNQKPTPGRAGTRRDINATQCIATGTGWSRASNRLTMMRPGFTEPTATHFRMGPSASSPPGADNPSLEISVYLSCEQVGMYTQACLHPMNSAKKNEHPTKISHTKEAHRLPKKVSNGTPVECRLSN